MPRALLGVGSIAANEREFLWEYRQSISKQLYGWTYGNKFSGKKKTTFIRKKEVLCREF